jgi:sulfite exporter TauE/SafE
LDQLNELSSAPLYFIIFAGIISGLAGSLHCTGMCGGLVSMVARSKVDLTSYHIGRLLGYLAISLIIPLLGITAFELKNNLYLSIASAISLGGIFIYIGLKGIFNWKLGSGLHQTIEKFNQSSFRFIFSRFKDISVLKNFSIGSMSVFLPCGLLWTVIILSLSAHNWGYTAAFIISFWLGTVPALSFASTALVKFLRPLQVKSPKLISTIFLIIGIGTISYRIYGIYGQLTGDPLCH